MSIYDNYKKFMAKGGNSKLSAPTLGGVVGGSGGGGGGGNAKPTGQSPLEWGIDIISRGMYAGQGVMNQKITNLRSSGADAIKDVRSGKKSQLEAIVGEAINPNAWGILDGKVLEAGWKGLTSTDPADKKYGVDTIDNAAGGVVDFNRAAGRKMDDYVAPTLDNTETWGGLAAAVGRGAGGLALDVGLDPLTYGTLGAATAVKAGLKAANKGVKAAKTAKAGAAAPSAARGIENAAEEAAAAATGEARFTAGEGGVGDAGARAQTFTSSEAFPDQGARFTAGPAKAASPAGAANVASAPSPTLVRDFLQGASSKSSGLQLKKQPVPQLPKVSETISASPSGAVGALVKTNRELDKVARSARELVSEVVPKAAAKAGSKTSAPPAGVGDFARQFFGDSDVAVAKLQGAKNGPWTDVFPSTIVKNLSSSNVQAAGTYWRRLATAAADPAANPELKRFVAETQRFMAERRAAVAASKKGPSAPAASVAAEVPEAAAGAAGRTELLRSVLKDAKGKPTELGKELRAAIGDKLFRQLSSTRTPAATREQVFGELTQLAKNADEVSPTTFDGMHENVRHFVEDKLQLRREDFDLASRQKLLESELYAATPKVTDKATARGMDPDALKGMSAYTGLSPQVILNRADANIARITGDELLAKSGQWKGGTKHVDTADGRHYAVVDGDISTHAFATWIDDARKGIDAAVTPLAEGKHAGKVFATMKTAARRKELPDALRAVEKAAAESGALMGVYVDKVKVPMLPSSVYDSANDVARAIRAEHGADAFEAFNRQADRILYNPSTAAPDSLYLDATAAALAGKGDDVLDEILGRTASKYNGVSFGRQPMGKGRTGTYRHLRGEFTSDALRAEAIALIRQTLPEMRSYSQGLSREYAEKSLTDASAIASKVETEFAEAMASSEGAAFKYAAGLDKRVAELSKGFGASGHAVGLASEELAKQLPPWLVRRAKSVRSAEVAYLNASRAGKTTNEMRAMGAASEMRHTPVDAQAVADDVDELIATADPSDPLYGVGTNSPSAIDERVRGVFSSGVHAFRKLFDGRYGGVVDGIDTTMAPRSAVGSVAGTITHRQNDINAWANKHNTVRLGDSKETAGSAAFKALQNGVDEIPEHLAGQVDGAAFAAALADLKPLAGYFFDVDGSAIAGDLFWRAGAKNTRYLERAMTKAGLSKQHSAAFDQALAKGKMSEWWKSAEVENPAEFLTRYNYAVHEALGERSAMLEFNKTLRGGGLLSNELKPGFAKPALSGDSFFYAGLHESGMYVDKRVLDAMSEIDKKLVAARNFNGELADALNAVMSAWKTGMTIYRPGHHVRNTLSNGMLSFVDEGARNLGKSGMLAAKVLARRQGDTGLAGLSEIERLLGGKISSLKKGGDEVVQTTKLRNGQTIELTLDGLYDSWARRGGARSYKQSEDILEGKGKVQRAADLATFKGTKVGDFAAGLSENLDHHGYLQQYMQIVMNHASEIGTKYKNLDELYDFAINRSYKFHPDATMLAPFEAKVVRQLIPFYSWFRGTLPAVLETSLTQPGRVALAHKASFNIAQTFGIDAESYANPWPEDADVPDYLQEGVFGANAKFGDQMYTLNPGFAHQDLAKMFFGRGATIEKEAEEGEPEETGNFGLATLSNTGRELLGMMSPLFRVPAELATGVKWQSGQQIRSGADYIDDTLPYINYLSSGSGISLTGTLLDIPGAIEQGRPIERNNVQQGYQPSIFEEGTGEFQHRKFLNFLLGQGAQPVDTAEQAATKKADQKLRKEAREAGEEVDPSMLSTSAAPGAAVSGSAPASKGGKLSKADAELLMKSLNLSGGPSTPMPAGLDMGAVDAMQGIIEGDSGKKLTPSQRMSAAKDLQEDALRRQSAMGWSGYASGSLEAIMQDNPGLTVEQALAIAKYSRPNPFKKSP